MVFMMRVLELRLSNKHASRFRKSWASRLSPYKAPTQPCDYRLAAEVANSRALGPDTGMISEWDVVMH